MDLAARIPETGFRSDSEAMDAFLAWVADRGLTLYPHQEEAILEIFDGKHVVLDAPTGSGKSLVATALHFKTFAATGRAWYTAPIKALVSEKFFELCKLFGAEFVGLITGDGAVNRDAPIICCTAEILANVALRGGAKVTSVVMDEFHYYGDRDRGVAWQIPLLTLTDTTFLLMSATLGDTRAIREDLERRTQRAVAEVRGAHRPVPLEFSYSMDPLLEQLKTLVNANKAPVYVVHFTQREATEQAQALTSVDYCTKEEKKAIAEAVRGFGFKSPFGPTMRRYVLHGIGLHHAGLLPRYRLLVERLAQQGLLKVICGTDTLGVGVNVPIRTVLFTQLCKFDGEEVVILPVREFKQIAGRAGRAGYDTRGYVVVQAPAHVIENARVKVDPKNPRKKVVKAQPPTRGYKPWDEATFQRLVESSPEALESRFRLDHGRLLMAMQHAAETDGDARRGVDAMLRLVDQSHGTAKQKEAQKKEAAQLLEHLEHAAVVLRDGDKLTMDPTLQHDFSLHHSLSLFLLDALVTVPKTSPTYALDVVTWVEAILDNPRPVLVAQIQREKARLIGELKAAGVPYEDRMTQLEDVSWPKPNAEAIYTFFNAYADKHPWVDQEAIRPKAIAREMAETLASFTDYVGALGIQRSEGVLLRYLTEVYKALVQNVPQDALTDELVDVIAWLRALLGRVDASLLTEWEALLAGADLVAESTKKLDISADPRAFRARIRAELQALVQALAKRDWEEAASAVAADEAWGPDELAKALAPFLEEHGEVGFHAKARAADQTHVEAIGPHRWRVRQRLWGPLRVATDTYAVEGWEEEEDDATWTIEGVVDLGADTNPMGPIVALVALGP